ncbi:MAG: ATP-grasp domain-containing protein, partial [Bryobacteraceae bacterium]
MASYEKGHGFLQQAKKQGCRVFLLTSLSLQHEVNWPLESLDDIFYMPDQENEWNLQDMLLAVSHLCRTIQIDRIVPLDDFDLEKASFLREHLRLPGLGETGMRYFRDKLAMRMRATEQGIPVPEFTATFNYEKITRCLETVPPPWLLKPRLMAGAIGIKKFRNKQEVWDKIHSLGDQQSFFVLERFVPGDIFHVDSIWFKGEMVYAVASAYGTPPLDVTQEGGIFTTRIVERDSPIDGALTRLNQKVLKAFGLTDGVSHTEFIRAHEDQSIYFLETSARVGGAYISDLIQAATGIDMWAEWDKVELAAASGASYSPPHPSNNYAGLLVSLARQEWPDTSSFQEPELVWRISKRHHVGFVVKSTEYER